MEFGSTECGRCGVGFVRKSRGHIYCSQRCARTVEYKKRCVKRSPITPWACEVCAGRLPPRLIPKGKKKRFCSLRCAGDARYHKARGVWPQYGACLRCGVAISLGNRSKRYCSRTCYKAAYRSRHAELGWRKHGILTRDGLRISRAYAFQLLSHGQECEICFQLFSAEVPARLDHFHMNQKRGHIWSGPHRGWLCNFCNRYRLPAVSGKHDVHIHENSKEKPITTSDLGVAYYLLRYHPGLLLIVPNLNLIIRPGGVLALGTHFLTSTRFPGGA
mgnify:CR=1 FL=1